MNSLLYPYLQDTTFLFQLAKEKVIELYTKITVLNHAEQPIQDVTGRIINGSLNVDGKSAVRRTGNLTVHIEDEAMSYMAVNGLFSINKKLKIEVGVLNQTDKYSNYPIIWFPQGVYALISVSTSHSSSGTTMTIQLKDKMAFLNGECGGVIAAGVEFDKYDELNPETGDYITKKPTIIQIIQELVNHYGGEELHKILINDIKPRIKKVMRWTKDETLYLYTLKTDTRTRILTLIPWQVSDSVIIDALEKDWNAYKAEYDKIMETKQDNPQPYTMGYYNQKEEEYKAKKLTYQKERKTEVNRIKSQKMINTANQYTCTKYSLGDDIGYIYTDFYYPGELSANAGDNVCTILDKIKNTLGNFEYYYDLNGNFIFQEIKNYLNTKPASYILEGNADGYLVDRTKGLAVYTFDDSELITSYSNTPQYANLKNDFVVWGARETVEGKTLPIRYHLAIDTKPEIGNQYYCFFYKDPEALDLESLEPIEKASVSVEYTSDGRFPAIGELGKLYVYRYVKDGQTYRQAYYWDPENTRPMGVVNRNGDPDFNEANAGIFNRSWFYKLNTEEKIELQEFPNTGNKEDWNTGVWKFDDGDLVKYEGEWITKDESLLYSTEDKYTYTITEGKLGTYVQGDELPSGKKIGDIKIITAPTATKKSGADGETDKKYIWEKHVHYFPAEEAVIETTDWRSELYFQGVNAERYTTQSNYYYTELVNEWPKLYDLKAHDHTTYATGDWREDTVNNPTDLDFFLDFIDTNSAISEFSISNIGRRTKVLVDDKINCIFEPQIPDHILIENIADNDELIAECNDNASLYVLTSTDIYTSCIPGGTYNSAFNAIQDLLYQHTGYNESITLQTLPLYFLEPNIRIRVRNEETGIYGDYMLNNFSVPLDIGGTMSLSCTRALDRL